MASTIQDGEYYRLSRLDIRVLVALLKSRMSAYEVGRQCNIDSGQGIQVSNSPLYHSLKSLEMCGFIKSFETDSSKVKRLYDITAVGRSALEGEVKSLENLVKLARERA